MKNHAYPSLCFSSASQHWEVCRSEFITLFVLIISIILFGILKILEGRELAAILSGIAGYILGKSRPNKAEKDEPEADENKTINKA